MSETAITPYQGNSIIRSFDDAERAAKAMATSGYFQDAKQAAQAVVKILAGQEMGFGPFASMTGIHIIHDRPAIGANLMAAAVKRHPLYDYRVIEMTDAACELAFFEKGQEIGRSRFTKDDAAKAGTQNMGKFPRNMLFARAISNGVRWYCPDVFNGSPVYTPEELGATVNEDGDVIEVQFSQQSTQTGDSGSNGKAKQEQTETTAPVYDPEKFDYPQGRQWIKYSKYKWASGWLPAIKKEYPAVTPLEVEGILLKLEITPMFDNDAAIGAVSAYLAEKARGGDGDARVNAGKAYLTACMEGATENG